MLLLKRSILTEKIARRGQHIVREYGVDPLELLRVREVMVRDVDTLPSSMTIDDVVQFFSSDAEHRHKSYPLVDTEGRVEGMAGRADVLRWRAENPHGAEPLFDRVSDRSLVVSYPDEPVSQLADRMVFAEMGRVAIVERKTSRIVGLVSRKDLLNMRAITRAAEATRTAYFGRRSASRGDAALAVAPLPFIKDTH